jgi:hypothetical protein
VCRVVLYYDVDLGFDFGMRFRSFGCDGMYRFMMRSGDSGLLDILKACR